MSSSSSILKKKSIFKTNADNKKKNLIHIQNRFIVASLRFKNIAYNAYNGIDIETGKWVTVYIKPKMGKFYMFKKLKEQTLNSFVPAVLWQGNILINEMSYLCQVHEKCGPSLGSMFERVKVSLSGKQLLHLLLQMIKLIERLSNNKLVYSQLTPESMYFSSNPIKTDLCLLNSFALKYKNQKQCKVLHTKFCSIGSHHGRSPQTKDDLQSIIYILIDLFLPNTFLKGVELADYQNYKIALNISNFQIKFPEPFEQFYCAVMNLNCDSEFNFIYWKKYLLCLLTTSYVSQPYHFLRNRLQNRQNHNKYSKIVTNQQIQLQFQTGLLDLKENQTSQMGDDDDEFDEYSLQESSLQQQKRSKLVNREVNHLLKILINEEKFKLIN